MSKNRALLLACGVVAALLVASAAIAAVNTTTKASVTAASSTFTATTVSHVHNTTCTAKSGDSFQSTNAVYKGTSTSQDARLNGDITIKAHSFLDTTSGLGTIRGKYVIKGTGQAGVHGFLRGVISNGALSGLARGHATSPAGALLASLGGTFDQASGFAAGDIGSASTGGGAVISNGFCPSHKH